jgi:hypothetical protein
MKESIINLDDPKVTEQFMIADSAFWAEKSHISLLGGTIFTLDDCKYLADIMRSQADEKVIMKGAQARITTIFMIDAIHGLIHNLYPQGVIYYFPTEKAVEGFSKTRFGPLVADNPAIRRHLQNTNSVSIKRVGKTFLSLLGAKATQSLQGTKKDGTSVRSTPADYIIRDERDLFDESMVRMTKDRLQNSKIAKEVDLGTPTIPDFGISKSFNESDQRYWKIPCQCGKWTCIVEEFPQSIRFKDNEPYFACIKCGDEIYPRDGQWVAKYPDRRVAGWLVSHFITPNIKLRKVMTRWEHDQREGKIGEFYNGVLGLPFIPAENRLRHSDVYACCGNDVMRTDVSISETALGADIGKHYHTIVIAEKLDTKRAKIIYLARVKGFQAIHDIAKKYNVKSAVIDRRPYEEEFTNFQNAAKFRVFGAEYKDRQKDFLKTDEKTGTYSLLRNQIFDKTHAWIKNKEIELPRKSAEVDEFVKQMCNCAKVLEENEAGDRVYRYIKLGDDHYRSAVNYLYMALQDLTAYQGMNTPGWGVEEEVKDWNPLLV